MRGEASCVSLPFSKPRCEETISAASIERLNVVGASKAMGLRSGALRVHESEGYLKLERNKSSPCSVSLINILHLVYVVVLRPYGQALPR